MRIPNNAARGLTLIELIVVTTILLILSGMAVPMARVTIKRERERQLRQALWAMRDGIDVGGKKQRFLRRILIDPMTGGTDWGLRLVISVDFLAEEQNRALFQ